MRRALLIAVLAITLAARAAGQVPPARPDEEGPLTDPARAILADVLIRSIVIGHQREVAAFIVRHPDGAIGCILWPRQNLALAATFYGIVPPNTIALVHSHPLRGAPPSKADIDVARIQNLPHYVVNMTHVWRIDPSGQVTVPVQGRLWLRDLDRRPAICRDAVASLAASR